MEPWLIWLLAGLVLLGAELLLPGAFLLWAGLAAIGTGLLSLALAPGFPALVIAFVALLAAGIALALRRRRGTATTTLNTPGAGLVGRTGTVLPYPGPGLRVRLGDGDRPARSLAAAPGAGESVRVEAVDGMVLLVRPQNPDTPGG